jgi:hypothetical protein
VTFEAAARRRELRAHLPCHPVTSVFMIQALRFMLLSLFLIAIVGGSAFADDLKTARTVIGKQIDQIKAGDVTGLKKGFTSRLQAKITEDNVKKAQKDVGSMTLEDLVDSAQGGGDSIKVKMKNGRGLTTLVKTKGRWLADTVWFK